MPGALRGAFVLDPGGNIEAVCHEPVDFEGRSLLRSELAVGRDIQLVAYHGPVVADHDLAALIRRKVPDITWVRHATVPAWRQELGIALATSDASRCTPSG